jgi:hypothetical protein
VEYDAERMASGTLSSMDNTEKVRENRLRRMAERQGLQLRKSRRRDTRAYDFGTYRLADPRTNMLVVGGYNDELNLGELEAYLTAEYDIRLIDPQESRSNPGGVTYDGRPMMVWRDPSHGLRAGWVLNYLEQGAEFPGVEDYEIGGDIDDPDRAIESGRGYLRRIRYPAC